MQLGYALPFDLHSCRPDAFEQHRSRLVVRILLHELSLEGPLENGLAEAVAADDCLGRLTPSGLLSGGQPVHFLCDPFLLRRRGEWYREGGDL